MTEFTAAILHVDDEAPQREYWERRFRGCGYLVLSYMSGRQAIRDIEDGLRYHLAVVDLSLQAVDGVNVLRASKKAYPDVPVIIVSAYSNRCISGADGHLIKGEPHEEDRLEALVKQFLSKSSFRALP